MSQLFDEWKAAKTRRDAAKEKLLRIPYTINDIAELLQSASDFSPGDSKQAMVPNPPDWPTTEEIKRAIQEFNAAHIAEWQKFEFLPPDEKGLVSGSR
jgi:hypothetical protein